jgi:hypothetical protein
MDFCDGERLEGRRWKIYVVKVGDDASLSWCWRRGAGCLQLTCISGCKADMDLIGPDSGDKKPKSFLGLGYEPDPIMARS